MSEISIKMSLVLFKGQSHLIVLLNIHKAQAQPSPKPRGWDSVQPTGAELLICARSEGSQTVGMERSIVRRGGFQVGPTPQRDG